MLHSALFCFPQAIHRALPDSAGKFQPTMFCWSADSRTLAIYACVHGEGSLCLPRNAVPRRPSPDTLAPASLPQRSSDGGGRPASDSALLLLLLLCTGSPSVAIWSLPAGNKSEVQSVKVICPSHNSL